LRVMILQFPQANVAACFVAILDGHLNIALYDR
jgi:hypothetical protein